MTPTSDLRADRMHADHPTPEGHEWRYHLAAGFVRTGTTVVDAACGSGYGAEILMNQDYCFYVGVDQDISECPSSRNDRRFVTADLRTWTPDFGFDVWVGFETIEHLTDYSHYIAQAKRAGRWILVSVPVVPTRHDNPWHLHDFSPGDLAGLFVDDDWSLYQSVLQPSELSEVYVFARR